MGLLFSQFECTIHNDEKVKVAWDSSSCLQGDVSENVGIHVESSVIWNLILKHKKRWVLPPQQASHSHKDLKIPT